MKLFLFVFLLSHLAACGKTPREQGEFNSESRGIRNGADASALFPAVGALRYESSPGVWSPFCTGSLVHPQIVLTAAHCVTSYDWNGIQAPIEFSASSIRFSLEGMGNLQVSEIVTPDSYLPLQVFSGSVVHSGMDIALLVLTAPVSGVEPLNINAFQESFMPLNGTITIVGYGFSQTVGGVNSNPGELKRWGTTILRGYEQGYFDLNVNYAAFDIAGTYQSFFDFNRVFLQGSVRYENALLASRPETVTSTSVCQGDSGGPALANVEGISSILGVASFGNFPGGCVGSDFTYHAATSALQARLFLHQSFVSRSLPLQPPANLAITGASSNPRSIRMSWGNRAELFQSGIEVWRKMGSSGTYSKIATLEEYEPAGTGEAVYPILPSSFNDTDSTLLPSQTYYYKVRAISALGASDFSSEVSGAIPQAPNAPTGLSASLENGKPKLAWSHDEANLTDFILERKTGSGSFQTLGDPIPALRREYLDSTAASGTTYTYRILARMNVERSGYSNEASATTPAQAPTAPSVPVLVVKSTARVDLSWVDNSNDEQGFKILRSTTATGTFSVVGTVAANVQVFSNTNLTSGTNYYYKIRAYKTSSVFTDSPVARTKTSAPAAPTYLASPSKTQSTVDLKWTDNSFNETNFVIFRATGTNAFPATPTYTNTVANQVNLTATGLLRNTTYRFKVVAKNGAGSSTASNIISVRTLP